jgi:hypothetical protein
VVKQELRVLTVLAVLKVFEVFRVFKVLKVYVVSKDLPVLVAHPELRKARPVSQ